MGTRLGPLFLTAALLAAATAGAEEASTGGVSEAVLRTLAGLEQRADRVRADVAAAHARSEAAPPPLARDVTRLRDAARALTPLLYGQPWTAAAPVLERLHRLEKTLAALDAQIAATPEPRQRPARDPATLGTGIITGRLTDAATGEPIYPAFVDVFDAGGDFVDSDLTEDTGEYLIDGLSSGTYFVRTQAFDNVNELFNDIVCDPDCIVTSGTPVPVTDGQTTSGIDFALLPLGTIEGTILDATSQLPLGNVQLRLFTAQGPTVGFGQTGSDGRYRVEGVHPGTYFVRAEHDAYLDEVFNDVPCQPDCDPATGTPILVGPASNVTGIDFELRLGGRISGTMTDAGSGEPISFARVIIFDSTGASVESAFTGSTGRYQALDLPTGTYFALTDTFTHADELYDNLPCAAGCTPTQGTPIAVVAGQERTGADFVLQSLGGFSGRITDGGGALRGARVEVVDAQGSFRGTTFSDVTGAYRVGGLLAGNHFAVATAEDHIGELYDNLPCHPSCTATSGTPIPVALGSIVPGIDFRLELGGWISGTVRRQANGAPVSGAIVTIYSSAGQPIQNAYTSPSGTFMASGLNAGTYFAKAEDDEFLSELYREIPCNPGCPPPATGTAIAVVLAQGSGGVDFTLVRLGRISGRVSETGTGLPLSAFMTLYTAAGQPADFESTDGTGSFLFTGVPPASYRLVTSSGQNVVDELYDNRTCEPSCNVTTGTPVTAALDTTTSGIDFSLRRPVFADVPVDHFAWRYVEAVYNAGVTSGCAVAPLRYCPDTNVTRAQMAVFLLRSKEGPTYLPPPAVGMFADVPASDPFARWIEELAHRQIAGGCALNPPRFCPGDPTTRAQMAPLLLVTREGAGYLPPAAVGVFQDVPASDPFARFIEELVRRQVTGGCSTNPPLYCPGQPTTRAQTAVFLATMFALPLP